MRLAFHRVLDEKRLRDISKGTSSVSEDIYVELDIYNCKSVGPIVRDHRKGALTEILESNYNLEQKGDFYTVEDFARISKDRINGVILDFKNIPLDSMLSSIEFFQSYFASKVVVSSFSPANFSLLKYETGVETQFLCHTIPGFEAGSFMINKTLFSGLDLENVDSVVTMCGKSAGDNIDRSKQIKDVFGANVSFFPGGVKTQKQFEDVKKASEDIDCDISGCYLDSDLSEYKF